VYIPLADLPDAGPKLLSLKEQDEDYLVYPVALVMGKGVYRGGVEYNVADCNTATN